MTQIYLNLILIKLRKRRKNNRWRDEMTSYMGTAARPRIARDRREWKSHAGFIQCVDDGLMLDMNTSMLVAKLFGFESTIIQGWFLISKATALVSKDVFIKKVACTFKKPLKLNSVIELVQNNSNYHLIDNTSNTNYVDCTFN